LSDFDEHRRALGAFIRSQRELTNLSLRQVAVLSGVSNPYLSQLERGLHEPSVRILRSIADALGLSAELLLEQAGIARHEASADREVEDAIRRDGRLTDGQKQALLAVYRSYRDANVGPVQPDTGGLGTNGSNPDTAEPRPGSTDAGRSPRAGDRRQYQAPSPGRDI
jgi:transcriptional regulator with XRE-family HTH domain